MNKLFRSIVVFLVLALVFVLCACKEEPAQEAHAHTFSETWTSDSTNHWHAATCEHADQISGKAAHTFGTPTVTKNPTCLESGSQTVTCSVCGATVTQVISATGHTYEEEWSHDGAFHWHLSSCEHTGLKGSFGPHVWENPQVLTPSTCEIEGVVEYTCACGATKTGPIPKHTFSEAWTGDESYHWHAATCEHTDQISDKAEHTFDKGVDNGDGTVTFTCTVCGKSVTENVSADISMIMAGPGEIGATQAVISWHSKVGGSSLEYRLENTDEWTEVEDAQCNEALSTADWYEGASACHYRSKVYLNDLIPGSTYMYRVKDSAGKYSATATFRTAEEDTTYFQFAWMSDLHTPEGRAEYINRIGEIIDYSNSKDGVDVDFVLFTGDIVEKGQKYEHWQYWSESGLLYDMTYAFLAGNHDYYTYVTDAETGETDSKARVTNDYFKDFAAYPANNDPEGNAYVLDSNYWFIWNRVMFVCVDNFTTEGTAISNLPGSSLSAQQAWFKAVVDANEGNYDYLIFAQHLPWFDTEDSKPCDYGNLNSWYKIFDQYKVDFALGSDEHTYRRTYPLYNKKSPYYVNEKNPAAEKGEWIDGKVSKGTIYVVSNHTTAAALSGLRNNADEGMKYIEYRATGAGGVYFTVTPTEMTLHQIGQNGREYDTVTVLKKDRSK